MKKQYLLQIILWLLPFTVLSQSVDFIYTMDKENKQRPLGITEIKDGYVALYRDYAEGLFQYKLLKLNKAGEKEKEIEIIPSIIDQVPLRMHITDVISVSHDTLCVMGSIISDNSEYNSYDNLYMAYYDSDLNCIWEKQMHMGNNYQIKVGRLSLNSKQQFLFYGGVNRGNSPYFSGLSPFILIIDKSGAILDSLYVQNSNVEYPSRFFDIKEKSNHTGYLATSDGTSFGMPDGFHQCQLINFDENLNVINAYHPSTLFTFYGNVLINNASDYIVTGTSFLEGFKTNTHVDNSWKNIDDDIFVFTSRKKDAEMLGVRKYHFPFELDKFIMLGDPMCSYNSFEYNYPSVHKSTDRCKTNDSLFYYTGTMNIRSEFQQEPSYILVNQLDLDLNIIWQTTIGEDEEDAAYINFVSYATSDGGVLLLNRRYDFKTHTPEEQDYDLHIVKLKGNNDTDGMAEFHAKKSTVVLYPNPATNEVHIKTADKAFEGILEILNMEGKVVLRKAVCNQTPVSIRNLESGIYLYNLYNDNTVFNGKFVKQ